MLFPSLRSSLQPPGTPIVIFLCNISRCFKIWLLMFCCSAHLSVAECKEDCLAPVNALFLCTCRLLDIYHVGAINTSAHLNAVTSNKDRISGLGVSFYNRKKGDILAKTECEQETNLLLLPSWFPVCYWKSRKSQIKSHFN